MQTSLPKPKPSFPIHSSSVRRFARPIPTPDQQASRSVPPYLPTYFTYLPHQTDLPYPMASRQAFRSLAAASTSSYTTTSTTTLRAAAASRRCASTFANTTTTTRTAAARRSTSSVLQQGQRSNKSRSYSSTPGGSPPPRDTNKISFWPFVALIALTSGGYMLLVNRRKGEFFFFCLFV